MRSMHSDPEQNALRDILRQIDPAQNFAQGQDRDAFSADIMRVYAVTRCLEIISEASRRLSKGLKARHPGRKRLPARLSGGSAASRMGHRSIRSAAIARRDRTGARGFELSATRACPRGPLPSLCQPHPNVARSLTLPNIRVLPLPKKRRLLKVFNRLRLDVSAATLCSSLLFGHWIQECINLLQGGYLLLDLRVKHVRQDERSPDQDSNPNIRQGIGGNFGQDVKRFQQPE